MSKVMDDWFGFDPPPEPPEPKDPVRPAPTRRTATANVQTGVDATRRFSQGTGTGSSTRTTRSLVVTDDEDELGVGLNV